ncbi:MAG: DivIVA domain-containing protein [Anaerovoracaceae bacterium]|jgi:cell division initiation protein
MIKPQEIETKVFNTSMRGYNKREVDEFLDEIMIDYQKALTENDKLKQAVTALNQRLNENKENEENVKKTLAQAKSLMSDISASAEKRAEAIVNNAKVDAETITQNAHNSVKEVNEETRQMRDKLDAFKVRFREFMNDEIDKISGGTEDLFTELKDDFYPEGSDADANDKAETETGEKNDDFLDRFFSGEKSDQQPLQDAPAPESGDDAKSDNGLDSIFNGLDEKLQPFDKAKTIVVEDTEKLLDKGTKVVK